MEATLCFACTALSYGTLSDQTWRCALLCVIGCLLCNGWLTSHLGDSKSENKCGTAKVCVYPTDFSHDGHDLYHQFVRSAL